MSKLWLAAEKRNLANRASFFFQRGFKGWANVWALSGDNLPVLENIKISLAHTNSTEAADSGTLVISFVIADTDF
jgi:hypothetical protein